jgi:hypothetical protein
MPRPCCRVQWQRWCWELDVCERESSGENGGDNATVNGPLQFASQQYILYAVCTNFAFYFFAQRHESSVYGLLPVSVLDIDSPCKMKTLSLLPCPYDQVYVKTMSETSG